MSAKPIGQSMVEANLINQYQLNELLEYQKNAEQRIPLGRLTVELGLVKDEEFAPFLASYFNVPYLNLEDCSVVQKDAIDSVPQFIARRLNILPLLREENTLTVAMSDPLDLPIVEDLETVTGYRIKRVVSPANRIRESIKSCYSGVFLRTKSADVKVKSANTSVESQKYKWPLAPSLIRLLIERAYKNSVNSVHMQPQSNRMEIFFRAEGKLEKIASYPKNASSSVLTYIKTAAKLDQAKNDIPQSGYFTFNNDKLNIEVGVSILPTLSGERIVLEVPRRMGWIDEEAWYKSA